MPQIERENLLPFGLPGVGDLREVRTEEDPVGVFFKPLPARVDMEEVGKNNGGVKEEILKIVGQGEKFADLLEAQMRDDEGDVWVLLQRTAESGNSAHGPHIVAVPMLWLSRETGAGPAVDEEDFFMARAGLVDRLHPRVVGGHLLDMAMDLDPVELVGLKTGLKNFFDFFLVWMDASKGDDEVPMPFREFECPLVESFRHPFFVRVVKRDTARDPFFFQDFHQFIGVMFVMNWPGVFFEPAPDRIEKPIREKMGMEVDDLHRLDVTIVAHGRKASE